jgi:glutathione S-transferase
VDGDLAIWDTLAIAEYLAEQFPDKQLWPADRAARARARSICAEMHSGFTGLRGNCPMNIEASLAKTGALIWRDKPGSACRRAAPGGNVERPCCSNMVARMLFGHFTVADAYFAPVCMRITTYGLPVPADIAAYM